MSESKEKPHTVENPTSEYKEEVGDVKIETTDAWNIYFDAVLLFDQYIEGNTNGFQNDIETYVSGMENAEKKPSYNNLLEIIAFLDCYSEAIKKGKLKEGSYAQKVFEKLKDVFENFFKEAEQETFPLEVLSYESIVLEILYKLKEIKNNRTLAGMIEPEVEDGVTIFTTFDPARLTEGIRLITNKSEYEKFIKKVQQDMDFKYSFAFNKIQEIKNNFRNLNDYEKKELYQKETTEEQRISIKEAITAFNKFVLELSKAELSDTADEDAKTAHKKYVESMMRLNDQRINFLKTIGS